VQSLKIGNPPVNVARNVEDDFRREEHAMQTYVSPEAEHGHAGRTGFTVTDLSRCA
jgi:hypothetical protein